MPIYCHQSQSNQYKYANRFHHHICHKFHHCRILHHSKYHLDDEHILHKMIFYLHILLLLILLHNHNHHNNMHHIRYCFHNHYKLCFLHLGKFHPINYKHFHFQLQHSHQLLSNTFHLNNHNNLCLHHHILFHHLYNHHQHDNYFQIHPNNIQTYNTHQ